MASSLSTWFRPYASESSPSPKKKKNKPQRVGGRKARNSRPATSEVRLTRQGKRALSSSAGVEATTYTCLPPRDDFDSSPSVQFAAELKLSDPAAFRPPQTLDKPREDGIDDDDDDDDWEAKYGKFEVFEVDGDREATEEDGEVGQVDPKYGKYEVYELGSEDEEDEYRTDFDEINARDQGQVEFEGISAGNEGQVEFEGINPGDKEYDEEAIDVKEKGIPAVMRCFDRAKIFVKAGDGGNGVVAFRREKFVPLGGPSGGDGGRGGGVYVEAMGSMNSLLPFRSSIHFRAGRGSHGQGKMMAGAKGEDVVVQVPPGTVIRESGGDGEVLLELLRPGQRALLLPGGRGGRGNASFKSGGNKVPRIAENGEEGPEMWLELELKLVADIGIVGAPNAGKSTLLSAISAAQPAIANYPFTTLLPNLGVVSFDFDSTIVVADLPGLLEGAHRGFGLGHEFLRHTERCSSLVHVVDGSSQQPELEFEAVRLELELFSPEIADKSFIVAFNKMDLPEARENWPSFKKSLRARGIEPFCMSAAQRDGTREVILAAHKLLQERKASMEDSVGSGDSIDLNRVADMVRKQRTASINEFEITRDGHTGIWHVEGAGLQRFVQMTNWRYVDSERRFQHVLDACGVNKTLVKLGVKEGDTVTIGEMEMEWHDSVESSGLKNMKRSSDSTKWAEWK